MLNIVSFMMRHEGSLLAFLLSLKVIADVFCPCVFHQDHHISRLIILHKNRTQALAHLVRHKNNHDIASSYVKILVIRLTKTTLFIVLPTWFCAQLDWFNSSVRRVLLLRLATLGSLRSLFAWSGLEASDSCVALFAERQIWVQSP